VGIRDLHPAIVGGFAGQIIGRLADVRRPRQHVTQAREEYDPSRGRLTGNLPQALSHLALVNSALLLSRRSVQYLGQGPGER
jgi:hypothetical protein